ncbi:HNH endonuclease [Acinetobacter gerneri]|uniref:HNH endonuclease n=1 Tax=Acinetobacter gerneri TaxID=202952 RepID=UPI0028A93404|nr:HNH endonuclease [Acinetobacter gerneri]
MNAWIFQGSADYFDVNSYLNNFNLIYWSLPIKKHQQEIGLDDFVFIWRSKGKSREPYGLVALTKVVEIPKLRDEVDYPHNLGNEFWKANQGDVSEVKVGLRVINRRLSLCDGLLEVDVLKKNKILANMQIIKVRVGTSFKLSESEFGELKKYWEGMENIELDHGYTAEEWTKRIRAHLFRERDREIIRIKKNEYLRNHVSLMCELCGFSFIEKYGFDFAEVHHKKQLSKIKVGEKTHLADLAIVCANCHRALHKLDVDDSWLFLQNKFKSL